MHCFPFEVGLTKMPNMDLERTGKEKPISIDLKILMVYELKLSLWSVNFS